MFSMCICTTLYDTSSLDRPQTESSSSVTKTSGGAATEPIFRTCSFSALWAGHSLSKYCMSLTLANSARALSVYP